MISKLPRWIWFCAWVLACIAGAINVVGLIGFQRQAVTHLTGNTSMLGNAVARLDFHEILQFSAVIGSFVGGAALSGFIIQDTVLRLGRRYGIALFLESMMLCLAVPLLNRQNMLGFYLTSCACGLQNAMATTYSGTIIRTTHVSGMFTDLGIFIGHFFRGLSVDQKRMRMSFLVISGFFSGGIIGTLAFRALGYATLFIPAGITAAASITYVIHQIRNTRSSIQSL